MSLKRLFLMALGALAALAFMAPMAQADQGDDDAFGAAACVLSPGQVAGTAGVESVGDDLPFLLDVDSGTFEFDGPAICGGADVASSSPGLGGVLPDENNVGLVQGTFQIHADGEYNNLVCGTGTANGTANLSGGGNDIDTSFAITFAAGVGQLSIVVHDHGQAVVNGNDQDIDGGSGQGVIDIVPTESDGEGSSCVSGGVTGFLVNGAFETSLTGDGSSEHPEGSEYP